MLGSPASDLKSLWLFGHFGLRVLQREPIDALGLLISWHAACIRGCVLPFPLAWNQAIDSSLSAVLELLRFRDIAQLGGSHLNQRLRKVSITRKREARQAGNRLNNIATTRVAITSSNTDGGSTATGIWSNL
jgi:hypothetical protein